MGGCIACSASAGIIKLAAWRRAGHKLSGLPCTSAQLESMWSGVQHHHTLDCGQVQLQGFIALNWSACLSGGKLSFISCLLAQEHLSSLRRLE